MGDKDWSAWPSEMRPASGGSHPIYQPHAQHGHVDVGIIMGSASDLPRMGKAAAELEKLGRTYEATVRSAHRDPEEVVDYVGSARERGLHVIIAGAGLAAALPGVCAAHTELPVIGVPLTSSTSVANGLDALLAISQMPPGVPVATVGVDNSKNGAALAGRILNLVEVEHDSAAAAR